MRSLKQTLIWLKRFRYRCGYGVHSPFAFDFITNVIYEKTAYYAYRQIRHTIGNDRGQEKIKYTTNAEKINKLLFRLVNRTQPQTIVDLGGQPYTSLYLLAAKKGVDYIAVTDRDALGLMKEIQVDFLHINVPDNPIAAKEIIECAVGKVRQNSVFAIQGIYHSNAMKTLWKQFVADDRVGITFDLYDIGIAFFDKTKIKQHYIVNF